jgi:hypothetical protein
METKRHQVNLKQYRKLNGKWQFVPVARDAKGKPDPRLVLVDGRSIRSKGGTFYLDFSENGKLRQKSVGTVPKEAHEAWRMKLAVLTGEIEPAPDEEPAAGAGLLDRLWLVLRGDLMLELGRHGRHVHLMKVTCFAERLA